MLRHTMRWIAAGATAALVLAACSSTGSSGSDTSASGGTDASGADSTSSAPADSGSDTASGDPIVFGELTDTSGGASAYAGYTSVAMKMAIDEINESGGIDGRPIKLISESDGSDTTQTPTLMRRLIDDGADLLLMNSGSASAIAGKSVCVEENVLCVAPTNLSADIVNDPDADNIYILGPTSAGIGEAFATGMTKAGYKSLAVIADDVPTIQGYVPILVGAITDTGITQVAEEKVAGDATDVSAQVARVKEANPDVVLVMSLGGQTEALVQNTLHQQMPDVARFSLASIGNQPTTWKLADPGALDGLVFAGSIDPTNERTTDFASKLAALSGDHTDLTAYGAQGYDAIYMIKDALEKASDLTDKSTFNAAFQQVQGYQAHYGQSDFTLSYAADKHVGSDGNCGLVLATFGADNAPGDPWSVYQPTC